MSQPQSSSVLTPAKARVLVDQIVENAVREVVPAALLTIHYQAAKKVAAERDSITGLEEAVRTVLHAGPYGSSNATPRVVSQAARPRLPDHHARQVVAGTGSAAQLPDTISRIDVQRLIDDAVQQALAARVQRNASDGASDSQTQKMVTKHRTLSIVADPPNAGKDPTGIVDAVRKALGARGFDPALYEPRVRAKKS